MFWFVSGCVLLESAEIQLNSSKQEETEEETLCGEDGCQDLDQDGYSEEEDCDDQDASLISIELDLDCDGYSNEIDPCPEDPFDDLDQDGICGDQDPECNMDFSVLQENLEERLAQIASCSTIEGDLYIYDISEGEFPVFEKLEAVEGSVFIGNNQELHTINAFPSLVSLMGVLRIQDNPQLKTLEGFDKLSYVQRVEIFNHPELCVSDITLLLEELNYPNSEQAGNNSDC